MRAPIRRLAKLRSYNEALQFLKKTKKTRDSNYVPLGERRYHADHNLQYVHGSVVGADSDKIVVNTFGHPLIVFEAGTDRVTINPDSGPMYAPQLDTVWAVLGLRCQTTTNGKFTVYVNAVEEGKNLYDQKFVLSPSSKFYVAPLLGGWSLLEKPVLFTYHINRREANIVRESVQKFKDYIELMLKVRGTLDTEEVDYRVAAGAGESVWSANFPVFIFRRSEFMNAFGPHPESPNYTAVGGWTVLIRKPTNARSLTALARKTLPFGMRSFVGMELHMTEWAFYECRAHEFMQMVTSGNPEKYYKALLILAFCAGIGVHALLETFGHQHEVAVAASHIRLLEVLDEIILKANSNKCFRIIEVGQGVVPTDKYANYVFWGDQVVRT